MCVCVCVCVCVSGVQGQEVNCFTLDFICAALGT